MIKLVTALALARDQVDRSIAFGEAIPRLERLKAVLWFGLAGACLVLAIGYISMSQQVNALHAKQDRAEEQRQLIITQLRKADVERDQIAALLKLGQ